MSKRRVPVSQGDLLTIQALHIYLPWHCTWNKSYEVQNCWASSSINRILTFETHFQSVVLRLHTKLFKCHCHSLKTKLNIWISILETLETSPGVAANLSHSEKPPGRWNRAQKEDRSSGSHPALSTYHTDHMDLHPMHCYALSSECA